MAVAEADRGRQAVRRPRLSSRLWADRTTIALAARFHAAYIVRSGFSVDGRTYFVLHDDAMI